MKCPLCEGEFEPVSLRSTSGDIRRARRCSQCNGFWLDHGGDEGLSPASVTEVDTAQPNYSLQSLSLLCPQDRTLLEQSEHDAGPTGFKMWSCSDCKGTFYPRGQLALSAEWMAEHGGAATIGLYSRSQAALAVMLIVMGGILSIAAFNSGGFQAAVAEPLPTSGPNILTLVLIGAAYVSGTVLAVLGRRLPIIFMGWGVIAICVFGFFVIILGP